MNIQIIRPANRRFVTELLSQGISKSDLVSAALGVAISTVTPVNEPTNELSKISLLAKESLEPEIRRHLDFIVTHIPLNVNMVSKMALKHYKTKVLLSSGSVRHLTFIESEPRLSTFSLLTYNSKDELDAICTKEGIELVNKFIDLISEVKNNA